MSKRRPFPLNMVDITLIIVCAFFLFVLFPQAFVMMEDLNWMKRTGIINELQRFGVVEKP